jgi:hypothetical protein
VAVDVGVDDDVEGVVVEREIDFKIFLLLQLFWLWKMLSMLWLLMMMLKGLFLLKRQKS